MRAQDEAPRSRPDSRLAIREVHDERRPDDARHTARQQRGSCLENPRRESPAMPGASLDHLDGRLRRDVAGATPVPPVVRTTRASSASSRNAAAIVVTVVERRGASLRSLRRQELRQRVPALVGALPLATPSETVSTALLHGIPPPRPTSGSPASLVFFEQRTRSRPAGSIAFAMSYTVSATVAAVRASISTPVCAVRLDARRDRHAGVLNGKLRRRNARAAAGDREDQLDVRFAAMILAICAVARASFGQLRSALTVSACIATKACATARRRSCGFPPTSTMWTSPASPTGSKTRLFRPFQAEILVRDRSRTSSRSASWASIQPSIPCPRTWPRMRSTPSAPVRRHPDRLVERFRLRGDVKGVHRQRPIAELFMRARVLGEHQDAVPLVDERCLLGDEIHAVEDRVPRGGRRTACTRRPRAAGCPRC